ncbi:hypothetical protein FRB99_001239 [Tulasnella sp. 403]|nr:hypothetical protein FRB99_001239 [Tulasnella sp. 403]
MFGSRSIALVCTLVFLLVLYHFRPSLPIHQSGMSRLPPLKYVVVNPRAAHTSTVIFMHGLGDTGDGWQPVAEMLAPSLPNTKWILPHARVNPVTLNMGMRMSSWFDITSLDGFDEEDEKGMLESVHGVNEIITAEVDAGTPANKIIIGGFSQGCALALLTGLTTERKLGGIVALSGWLPLRKKIKAMMSDHSRNLPLFWGHGTSDPVVQYGFGERSVKALQDDFKFKDVTLKSYPMGHSSHPQEIRDIQTFLSRVLDE